MDLLCSRPSAKLITFSVLFNLSKSSSICASRSVLHHLHLLCGVEDWLVCTASPSALPLTSGYVWLIGSTGQRSVDTGKLDQEFILLVCHRFTAGQLHPPLNPTTLVRHLFRQQPSLGSFTSSLPSHLQARSSNSSPLSPALKCFTNRCWFP